MHVYFYVGLYVCVVFRRERERERSLCVLYLGESEKGLNEVCVLYLGEREGFVCVLV